MHKTPAVGNLGISAPLPLPSPHEPASPPRHHQFLPSFSSPWSSATPHPRHHCRRRCCRSSAQLRIRLRFDLSTLHIKMSFIRPALLRTTAPRFVATTPRTAIAAFHATPKRTIMPAGPQVIDGTSMSAPETAHDPVGGVGRGGFGRMMMHHITRTGTQKANGSTP